MAESQKLSAFGPPRTRVIEQLAGLYFRETEEACRRAFRSAPSTEAWNYRMAGCRLRLEFAGVALRERITRVLEHLREPAGEGEPDLVLRCWDDAETGSGMALPEPVDVYRLKNHCVTTLTQERYRTFYQKWLQVVSLLDLAENKGFYCCYDSAALPLYEKAGPMRPVLNAFFNGRGIQIVHAAAVGDARGTVVLAGGPGSGKSSTALACLEAGMGYLGDDLCALSAGEAPAAYGLFNTAKMRIDTLERFPRLASLATRFSEFGEEKSYFHVHEHFPSQMARQGPVRALLLPRVAGSGPTRLDKAGAMDAMRALVPHTTVQVAKSDNRGGAIMMDFIARVPAYHLTLGENTAEVPALIARLLDGRAA
jgi:hypothetical protein